MEEEGEEETKSSSLLMTNASTATPTMSNQTAPTTNTPPPLSSSNSIRISIPSRQSSRRSSRRRLSPKRAILFKGIGYSLAWLISRLQYIIVVPMLVAGKTPSFKLLYMGQFTATSQGLFNLIVCLYPKIIEAKRRRVVPRSRSSRRGEQQTGQQQQRTTTWCGAIVEALTSRGRPRN